MSVLFPQTYSFKEFNTAGYVKGRYQGSYLASASFEGNIQPSTQEEIRGLNIGREVNGMIKIYTDKVFNITKEDTNINGDLIVYDSDEWEVIKLDNNTGTLLPHKRYFAELRNSNELE